jgi:hypothetical protein
MPGRRAPRPAGHAEPAHRLTFPAGISPVESTWVGCYDWCLAGAALGDGSWLDAE